MPQQEFALQGDRTWPFSFPRAGHAGVAHMHMAAGLCHSYLPGAGMPRQVHAPWWGLCRLDANVLLQPAAQDLSALGLREQLQRLVFVGTLACCWDA